MSLVRNTQRTEIEVLGQLMEERQISQRQIATYLHITEQAVSGKFHQRSKFSANQILALADFFEVSVDYLMGRSDTPWPDPWKDKEG